MHTPDSDWWKNFFHGIALDLWRAAVTDELTKSEAHIIQKLLALPNGAKVLDVPCGNGRHCLELAARGYRMTGLDIAVSFIEEARARAAQQRLTVSFHAGDMRHLPWRDQFDGAFCLGNSFGYMSDADNATFLRSVAAALKPGGRFVLQSPMVAEAFLPQFKECMSYEIGGIKFEVAHRYNLAQSRLETEYSFTRDGKDGKAIRFAPGLYLSRALPVAQRSAVRPVRGVRLERTRAVPTRLSCTSVGRDQIVGPIEPQVTCVTG